MSTTEKRSRAELMVDYFIAEATKAGPQLTADGEGDFDRLRRLGTLVDLLRVRLGTKLLSQVYHLHDHKGILSAGVRCEKQHFSAETFEKVLSVSWEDLGEGEVEVFYNPPWPR